MQVRGSFAFLSVALLAGLLFAGTHYARQALVGSTRFEVPATVSAPFEATRIEISAVEIPFEIGPADRVFLAELRNAYGTQPLRPRAQIQLLEQVAAHAQAHHPYAGSSAVAALLRGYDPARAGELLHRYVRLQDYRLWLESQREALRAMPPEQRRAALWDARRSAFGSDADVIWSAELRAILPLGSAIAAP